MLSNPQFIHNLLTICSSPSDKYMVHFISRVVSLFYYYGESKMPDVSISVAYFLFFLSTFGCIVFGLFHWDRQDKGEYEKEVNKKGSL